MNDVDICYSIEHDGWCSFECAASFERIVKDVLSRECINTNKTVCLSVLFADDEAVRELNRIYRGQDKSTNVLSFPCGFRDAIECDELPVEVQTNASNTVVLEESVNEVVLGSLAFALQTVQEEAERYERSFSDHMHHLFVHGVLHLLGYDHIKEQERETMESKEVHILSELGIANPYVMRDEL